MRFKKEDEFPVGTHAKGRSFELLARNARPDIGIDNP